MPAIAGTPATAGIPATGGTPATEGTPETAGTLATGGTQLQQGYDLQQERYQPYNQQLSRQQQGRQSARSRILLEVAKTPTSARTL
jgi:hypothetical protein